MAHRVALRWLGFTLALALGPAAMVSAEEWGGISPGTSTMETVRERYGAPSRETRQQVEGYDTVQWIYEGARAPAGMKRLTLEIGMLTPRGYRPNLVRFFVLEPKPRVFHRMMIVRGWGIPDGSGEQDGRSYLFYKAGLMVYLDETGEDALSMVFTVPQPEPKAGK
ncbi:MAG: hypothetical protein HY725_18775 [Candidatus Rokubacteria bacterium]|nr:hypothetical protein [Candidatus Rokubacteria bacterium]